MATIDFPSSPAVGQEYPFGDFIYVWDGVKWTTKVIVGSTEESDARYVNSTGDTMTGRLTVDVDNEAIRLSASASTASYILSQVNAASNWYVGKGSSANDNITLQSYIHGTSLNLLSTSVEVNKIFRVKAGAAQAIELWGTDHGYLSGFDSSGARQWYVGKGSSTAGVSLWDDINDTYMTLNSDHVLFSRDPRTLAAQGTGANSLTRKDYVDAALLVERTRIGELESVISTLTARIEALEAQVNLTSVM